MKDRLMILTENYPDKPIVIVGDEDDGDYR